MKNKWSQNLFLSYHPVLRLSFDHFFSVRSSNEEHVHFSRFAYERADFLKLYNLLTLVDWTQLHSCDDVSVAVDYFYNYLYSVIGKCCPTKIVLNSSKYPVWFTKEIICDIKLKSMFHKKY